MRPLRRLRFVATAFASGNVHLSVNDDDSGALELGSMVRYPTRASTTPSSSTCSRVTDISVVDDVIGQELDVRPVRAAGLAEDPDAARSLRVRRRDGIR
jgi:hypothetical protein